jgi:hypothetical protein
MTNQILDLTYKPLPERLDLFPCDCSESGKRGTRCTKHIIRCNVRLAAVRKWRSEQPDVRISGTRVTSGKDSKQDYATPADFMSAVKKRFGPISFDLAAHNHNRKHDNYFAPCTTDEGPMPLDPKARGIDAFDHSWARLSTVKFRRDGAPGLLWLNCEFSEIPAWAERCAWESLKGANILLLTPVSVGANWYSNLIVPYADTYFLKPRIAFIPKKVYNKDCMLSHFVSPEVRSSTFCPVARTYDGQVRIVEIWDWNKNLTIQQWTRPLGEVPVPSRRKE